MKKLSDFPVFSKVIFLVLVGLLVVGLMTLVGIHSVRAAEPPIYACTIDSNGANDVPGQQDLTQMCTDVNPANNQDWNVKWNWDEISGSGGNTYEACAMFDSDGDGNVNYAVCVQLLADSSNIMRYNKTIQYNCSDLKADRCTQPQPKDGTLYQFCSAAQAPSDPFPTGAAYTLDTVATCTIPATLFSGTPVLTNVCSFTSYQNPNSDPSDCIAPATGTNAFFTIVKSADPDVDEPFGFTLTGSSATWTETILGSGAGARRIVTPGLYSVTESSMPTGWDLLSSTCVDEAGTVLGSGLNPKTAIPVSSNDDIVCTFTDRARSVDLSVDKSDGDYTVTPYPSTINPYYKYTITVTNSGDAKAYAVHLVDTFDPYLSFDSSHPITIDGSPAGNACWYTPDATPPAGGTIECNLGDLVPGSVEITYWVKIESGVPTAGIVEIGDACPTDGSVDVCNKVEVSTISHETNLANNIAYEPKDIGAPTAVELLEFVGTGAKNAVKLDWITANEYTTLGFNIYRAGRLDGTKKLVNNGALINAETPGLLEGHSYSIVIDGLVAGKYYYFWLEDIDLKGNTSLHGPILVKAKKK